MFNVSPAQFIYVVIAYFALCYNFIALIDMKLKKLFVVLIYSISFISLLIATILFYKFVPNASNFQNLVVATVFLTPVIITLFTSSQKILPTLFVTFLIQTIASIITSTFSFVSIFTEDILIHSISRSIGMILWVIYTTKNQSMLRVNLVKANEAIKGNYVIFTLMPFTYYCLHCIFYLNKNNFRLENFLLMMAVNIIIIISYSIFVFSLVKATSSIKSNAEKSLYDNQIKTLVERINTLQQSETTIAIMQNDVKNYSGTIKTLLANNQIQDTIDYITWIKNNVDNSVTATICDNVIINACLSHYFNLAEKNSINIKHRVHLPKNIPLNAFELSNVFANALENAINASKLIDDVSMRKIRFSVDYNDDMLLVKVSNHCTSPVVFNDLGFPITNSSERIGIGVSSINAFAQNNNATVNYNLDNDTFVFAMIVNLNM